MAYFNTKEQRYVPIPIPPQPPYNPPIIPDVEEGSTPNIPRPNYVSDTNIYLYKCLDDENVVHKKLNNQYVLTGTFKEDTDMLEPELIIESEIDLTEFNYAYISIFHRYYFTRIELISGRRYKLKMLVDPLTSLKNQILYVPCIIDKEEEHNELYINDGTFVQGNKNYTTIINYNNGFNDTHENILICCGGV